LVQFIQAINNLFKLMTDPIILCKKVFQSINQGSKVLRY